MNKPPQDTFAEKPDGGNPRIRFQEGPRQSDRPGLLNIRDHPDLSPENRKVSSPSHEHEHLLGVSLSQVASAYRLFSQMTLHTESYETARHTSPKTWGGYYAKHIREL